MNSDTLTNLLRIVAVAQIAVATLNLFLTRLLKWKDDVKQMPLLLREVFHVHAWFISVTLGIFGVLTWRFAASIANGRDELANWLALSIGLFWALRTCLQIFYYSASHWRGQPGRTVIHVVLLVMYGGMAAAYLFSTFGGGYDRG